MLSRRALLGAAAAVTAVLGGGALVTLGRWWDRPPGEGYRWLSLEEAAIVRAVAGAAWPGGEVVALEGETAGLDHFFDEMLATMPETPVELLKLLLHVLDDLASLDAGTGLANLSKQARSDIVMGWLASPLPELRSATTGLVVLLGMGYTTHPEARWPFPHLYGCGYAR